MKKLSKNTIARLRAVAAAILKEPSIYNQGLGCPARRPSKKDPCGTAGCLLGWAVTLFGSPYVKRKKRIRREDGAAVLGLNHEQATKLWHSLCWPAEFAEAYALAGESHFLRACVASARIEHFIRTNGAE